MDAVLDQIIFLGRITLAFFLGGLVGWEREIHGKPAGIRTYGAICLGACIFGVVSQSIPGADSARVAAQVVSGIGFLGAGLIFHAGDSVEGLTTAAGLWCVAAVGLAISFGFYWIGGMSTAILVGTLYVTRMSWWSKVSAKGKRRKQKTKKKES